jgi:hypothetical protein
VNKVVDVSPKLRYIIPVILVARLQSHGVTLFQK